MSDIECPTCGQWVNPARFHGCPGRGVSYQNGGRVEPYSTPPPQMFRPLNDGEQIVRRGQDSFEIIHEVTDDLAQILPEIDYAGLQADLDELEAEDPEVAAAAERLDAATRCIAEAHRKVAALPASQRRDLMLGFLNAEAEAAALLNVKRPSQ